MSAQLPTPWLVLAGCCCLFMSVQAIKGSDTKKEEYSPILSKSVFSTEGADAREDFTLTGMFFTYTGSDHSITSTTLKMCSDIALTDTPDKTMVTVVFRAPDEVEYSVEGALVDGNFCAEFVMAYLVPDTIEPMTYTLVVDEGTLETSTATFGMTVDVTVLSCGQKELSRVSRTDSETKLTGDCMTIDERDMVCYREEDLTDQDICFTTGGNDVMEICRNGGVVVAGEPSQISVNYLAYDPANPDPASLSLLFGDDTEKTLEVTLWKDSNTPYVLLCDGACVVPSFELSNSVYEMCAFLPKGVLRGPLSGFASIQDVNLVAYDMKEDPLFIEYVFINSNIDVRKYIATLFTGSSPNMPVATVTADCVGVAVGHTCFGVIRPISLASLDNTYVSLQYTDAAFKNPTNRIVSKVQLLPEVGRNLSSLRDPAYSMKGSKHYSTTNA